MFMLKLHQPLPWGPSPFLRESLLPPLSMAAEEKALAPCLPAPRVQCDLMVARERMAKWEPPNFDAKGSKIRALDVVRVHVEDTLANVLKLPDAVQPRIRRKVQRAPPLVRRLAACKVDVDVHLRRRLLRARSRHRTLPAQSTQNEVCVGGRDGRRE